MPNKPLCFVLMPFGVKPDPAGRPGIDFDKVWTQAIRPAIEDAGLEPIRADEEKTGGIIHKPMFERLLLCEYAVADLTTANANVFYELGVRHTARPRSTQAIFAKHQPIPFDVNFLRALPYDLGENNLFGDAEAAALREALAERLRELRRLAIDDEAVDSPLFQLLGEWQPGQLARDKTDIFRQQVRLQEELKRKMERARSLGGAEGIAELDRLREEMGSLDGEDVAAVVDLYLSYRSLEAWGKMIELHEDMPAALKRQVLVREQLAFALNRRAGTADAEPGDRDRALELLEKVEHDQGPSAETCGLIGRIYKDLWDEARHEGSRKAAGHLRKAIAAYVRGFEADLRDAYPGVNAVTLLDVRGDEESIQQRDRLLPAVRFAVRQRLKTESLHGKSPDYWDYASELELAVVASEPDIADESLSNALAELRETWEAETTARNLELIRDARSQRGDDVGWIEEIISELRKA